MLIGLQNVTFEFGARAIVSEATWHIQRDAPLLNGDTRAARSGTPAVVPAAAADTTEEALTAAAAGAVAPRASNRPTIAAALARAITYDQKITCQLLKIFRSTPTMYDMIL